MLSNLFWLNLPAAKIRAELSKIDLLDIGCGTGLYFPILDQILGGLRSYTGVDVKPKRFAHADDPRVRLITSPAEQVSQDIIGQHNFIISQSALEHVPEEMAVLRHIAGALRGKKRPAIRSTSCPRR